jgi:hypothetical protein
MLLFRLPGLFLLRLAERMLFGLLFHEPPRSTSGPPPQQRRDEGRFANRPIGFTPGLPFAAKT